MLTRRPSPARRARETTGSMSRAGACQGASLLVMLHGCTKIPDDFAAGTAMNRLAEEQGLHRRLSKTAAERQSIGVLELVQPEGPEARRGRAEHHRRHHPQPPVGVRRRRVARLCGGPLGRRGDGGDHGRTLSRALRRRRRSLRSRLRFRRRLPSALAAMRGGASGARGDAYASQASRGSRTGASERSSFMGRTTRRSTVQRGGDLAEGARRARRADA